MRDKVDIKNMSFCDRHSSFKGQHSNVCFHIKDNLSENASPLVVVPLFIERVLFDKFYEKYWICQKCAEAFSISLKGELWFDINLRNFLENENFNGSGDDNFVIEIDDNLKQLIRNVCSECFMGKYEDQVKVIDNSMSTMHQRSFNN